MNGIVMYMYYLLEKKNEICVRRQNGRTNSYYRNDPKFSDRQVWANSADPDQTADQHLDCLPFRLHLVMRKPAFAMCEQKRHRSASLYAFHSQSNSPLLHVYMSYTSLDCKNAPIFSTVQAKKKNMCVYYCMEKLNRVDRLENVFILLKNFVWG